MIFVTGDTHGNYNVDKLQEFAKKQKGLTKSDYVIIAGDFGGVWFKPELEADLDVYSSLPFSILFVDGNHENFDLLNAYPVELWKGGKVHKVREDIIHLMRGQVFEIEGKTFFTFGGATSTDRANRREGVSWWKAELPTYEELDEGLANLKRYNDKVDYIITHAADEKALYYPPLRTKYFKMDCYPENQLLSNFEDIAEYRHWYFGHYHLDGDLTDKKTALFENIVQIS